MSGNPPSNLVWIDSSKRTVYFYTNDIRSNGKSYEVTVKGKLFNDRYETSSFILSIEYVAPIPEEPPSNETSSNDSSSSSFDGMSLFYNRLKIGGVSINSVTLKRDLSISKVSLDQNGRLSMKFSKYLSVNDDIISMIYNYSFAFRIEQKDTNSNTTQKVENYTIYSLSKDTLVLQLEFTNSLLLSTTTVRIY